MPPQIKLPENPTQEEYDKLKKPLIKAILNEFYTDSLDELTVEDGTGNVLATGKFLDKRQDESGRPNNRVFEYEIRQEEGGKFVADYKPISGNFNEPMDWVDDEDKLVIEARTRNHQKLEFAAGEILSEDWFELQEQQRMDTLIADLQEVGLGYLIVEA